jgi:hypothetical protein
VARALDQLTGDGRQRRSDVPGLEHDLRMREPERRQTCRNVHLVANPVSRLLRGSAVVAEAIRFDYESEFGQ